MKGPQENVHLHWLEVAKQHFIETSGEVPIPTLIFLRDGGIQLILMCDDGRFLAQLSRIATAGFESDELVFVSDTFSSSSGTNPEGKLWSRGEMTRRKDEPAVRATLSEQLLAARARRGQKVVDLEMVPYRRETSGAITWLDPDPSWAEAKATGKAKFVGAIPDALIASVNQGGILDVLAADVGRERTQLSEVIGLPADKMTFHSRIACMIYLLEQAAKAGQGVAVLWGVESPEEAEIVRERLPRFTNLEVRTGNIHDLAKDLGADGRN